MPNPYVDLPSNAFWRTGVVQISPACPEQLYVRKFQIDSSHKIATAGSCFAQHISQQLSTKGFNVIDLEPAPVGLPVALYNKFGFSMYSARYGNIYTAHQLLQLAKEAVGSFVPADFVWEKDGKFFDAFRPGVEPRGLDSAEEVRIHRQYHLEKVRQMFETMDLFIFTLGLTEAWIHKTSSAVYPTAPGVIAGSYSSSEYQFKNFNFNEILSALIEFQAILPELRNTKEPPKIMLTVSPVPLTATASGLHVLSASTYSKSVLRSVAGFLADANDDIDYFPSFEIITNPAARSGYFENNLRTISSAGVEAVMNVFFQAHTPLNQTLASQASIESAPPPVTSTHASDVQCEDILLEAFGR